MIHTTDCLRFGKSVNCPVCGEIHRLIIEGYTKKEITEIMRKKEEANYISDLHNIRATIVSIKV